MKKPFRLITLFSAMFFLAVSGCAGFQKQSAISEHEIHRLAGQGDAITQVMFESMYYKGVGVPRDYTKAAKWWRMAAEQGDAYSQRVLGEMYYHGDGVPQDVVRAYVWMSLAAAQDSEYAEMRDIILNSMAPQQIALAEELLLKVQNKIEQKTKGKI